MVLGVVVFSIIYTPLLKNINRISIHIDKYLLYVILSYYMYTCIFQIPILNQLFHHKISSTVVKSKFVT